MLNGQSGGCKVADVADFINMELSKLVDKTITDIVLTPIDEDCTSFSLLICFHDGEEVLVKGGSCKIRVGSRETRLRMV